MHRRFALAALLLLAGCARSEDASVVTDPNELQAVERVRTPEQDEEEIAIGAWRETLQDDFAALEFGPAGAPPLFSLRCDARRSVYLQRHGALPAGDLPMMLVTIGSDTRRIAVTSVAGTVPMLRASLGATDNFLQILAGSTEPIVVRIGDSAPLVLPPSPGIAAFLARCRSDELPAPAAADGNAAEAAGNGAEAADQAAPATPAPAAR